MRDSIHYEYAFRANGDRLRCQIHHCDYRDRWVCKELQCYFHSNLAELNLNHWCLYLPPLFYWLVGFCTLHVHSYVDNTQVQLFLQGLELDFREYAQMYDDQWELVKIHIRVTPIIEAPPISHLGNEWITVMIVNFDVENESRRNMLVVPHRNIFANISMVASQPNLTHSCSWSIFSDVTTSAFTTKSRWPFLPLRISVVTSSIDMFRRAK